MGSRLSPAIGAQARPPLSAMSTAVEQDFSLGAVQVALSPRERFEEFLRNRNKRFTRERKIILQQVFERHDHFDTDELVAELRETASKPMPSRPTVYRMLRELVDAGLLRSIGKINGREIYEHDYGYPQHDHLHCLKCDKLIEFHSDAIKNVRDAVAREHQFRVTTHRLIITGHCQECSRPKRRSRPLDLI